MEVEQKGTVIQVSVFVDKVFWDQFIINIDGVLPSDDYFIQCRPNDNTLFENESPGNSIEELRRRMQNKSIKTHIGKNKKYTRRISVDGYLLSSFFNLLQRSMIYRHLVIRNLKCNSKLMNLPSENEALLLPIYVKLVATKYEVIDLNWNYRLDRMLLEMRELDHAMSWFSTFGGAFSALGDEFSHCAEVAGKISLQQLCIAYRLGDPLTVARCKLYWALSMIQQGRLQQARSIIEMQYCLARKYKSLDERLVRMCFGIWAKLKYEYQLRNERKRKQRK